MKEGTYKVEGNAEWEEVGGRLDKERVRGGMVERRKNGRKETAR